jgi:hypothetical protein
MTDTNTLISGVGTISGSEPGIFPEKELNDKSSDLIHVQLRINWGKVTIVP